MLKGIVSVGSASALALASLVGVAAPANAAAALTIETQNGSGFTFVEDSDPVFVISGNSDFIASNGTQLRVSLKTMNAINSSPTAFKINGVALSEDYTDAGASSGNSIAFTNGVTDFNVNGITNGTQSTLDTTVGETTVFGLGATSQTFGVTYSTSVMTSPFTFQFNTGDGIVDNTTDTLLMTAWADANNNGVADSGEVQTSQTITFIAGEDVTGTVATTTPSAGDNNFTGTLDLNVNEAYVQTADVGIFVKETGATDAGAHLYTDGTTNITDGKLTYGSDSAFALNTAKTKFAFTVTPSTASSSEGLLAASGLFSSFTVQGIFDDSAEGAVGVGETMGNVVTVRTGAVAVSTTESLVTVVRSANAKPADGTTAAGTSSNADVRKNSEFSVLADFEDADGDNLVGEPVTWTVAASPVLSASKTVTVNGTAYSSSSDLGDVAIAGTTNASGRATLTIETTGFAAGETVTATATADGQGESVVATARTAAYTPEFADGSLTSNVGYGKSIAVGQSLDVLVAVADQWGIAPADGVQRVTLERATSTARTTAANWTYVVPVVGGFAAGTIADNGAGAGVDTVTATLSGTGTSSSNSADTMSLTYETAAANTVTGLVLTDNQGTGDSVVRIDEDALPAWHYHLTAAAAEPDADGSNFANGSTTAASDTLLAISGTATNAAGVGVAGKEVTISATGITFEYTDGASQEIYARDSITIPSTAGGAFSVNARSDGKGGATTFTATVDGVSATTVVTFDTGTASAMALSAPATARDGRAIDVIATVTDVAGDPVQGITVSFKATGVGYLSSLSGTTDATGQVVVKLITQTDETGSATITSTATLDGVSTTSTATIDVTATGEAAADTKVNAGSFKGYVAVYAKGYEGSRLSFKAGNDWNVTESLASDFERVVEFTGAGYTISVPIYIDRVLVDTIVVTTK